MDDFLKQDLDFLNPKPRKDTKKSLDFASFEVDDDNNHKKSDEGETEEDEEDFIDDYGGDGDWMSSPPVDYLEKVKGYEMVSFDTVNIPPPAEIPSAPDDSDGGQNFESNGVPDPKPATIISTINDINEFSSLTHSKAKEALQEHILKKCCYGRTAAKQMTVESLDYVPAFHYELQTFLEKRETSWTYAPHHKGGEVDGPNRGPAPLPWDIHEPPTTPFKEEVRVVTVPHTGIVKVCHKCRGTGGMRCQDCHGKGWIRCLHCHGDVYMSETNDHSMGRDRCYYCQHSRHGHGQQDCKKCQAKGKVSCGTCEGSTQIRCYIQLSLTWRVVTAEHILEKSNMPEDLIRDVSGQVAFEEEDDKVHPITAFGDDVIKSVSTNHIGIHADKFNEYRILRQRHQVRIVPVSKVHFNWKGKKSVFNVYGYENKVFLPSNSYPQSCCWGCSIL